MRVADAVAPGMATPFLYSVMTVVPAAVASSVTAAGTTVITLYKNGVAIPGATASATLIAGNTYQLNIPAAVTRETGCGCADASTITAVVSGTGFTAANVGVTVVKE